MKRLSTVFTSVLLACLLSVAVSKVNAKEFVEGTDFVKVSGIPESNQPVVREFFSYNCGHCYRQDPHFEQVAKLLDKSITFTHTPVGAGRESWMLSQQAFVAQKLQMGKLMHGQIFNHIHQQQGPFTRPQQVVDLFVANGADANKVEALMASADMQLSLSNYDSQTQLSGIRGVPAILVNGQYMVNNTSRPAAELAELLTYLANLK